MRQGLPHWMRSVDELVDGDSSNGTMAAGTIISEHVDVRPAVHRAHVPRAAAPPHPTAAPFWAMGLLNNSSFVVMIASAKAISDGGTALVFLCSVLPGLCIKLSAPFWFDRVTYRRRLLAASVLMAASFSTVAAFSGEESANMYMELFGVALCSVQGSMGEASLLALAGKYDNKNKDEVVANASRRTGTCRGDDGSMDTKSKKGKCITAFSSGTGLAGVFGFAYKFLFNQFLGLTLRKTLLLANALAFCYWACYWNYLDAHVESMNAGSSIVASYDEDEENNISNAIDNQNAACRGGNVIGEEGRLLQNETLASTKERTNDDVDGQGSGLELSRGRGRVGGISPTQMSTKDDDVGAFEDEYHEVDNLSGHCHEGVDEGMVAISSLSAIERLKLSASFWPYMVPLFTVYFAEYALQAGTWTAIGFPAESESARDEFYEYSNWIYQAGVFASRSSGTIYQASMAVFWLMPLLQCANLVLFSFIAATHFWYDYSLLVLCFYVGLLGGGVYVNGYLRINSDLPKPVREFALATVSVADTIGIVVADISGLFIQSCLYKKNGIEGAVVQCPLR